MFSATSVSEHFHVANFGRTPHPFCSFFFLAPSRNRGRGEPRELGGRNAHRPRQKRDSKTLIVLIQQQGRPQPRSYIK